jgi:asparagine synthase (glutamine-hydrolysing)
MSIQEHATAHARTATPAPTPAVAAQTPQCAPGQPADATDRFGIGPVCWRNGPEGPQQAARADILAGPGAALDPQALFDYFYFHSVPSPRTVWLGVQRLPPAHRLLAGAELGPSRSEAWWRPSFEPGRGASFDALKAEFRRLLRHAVAARLPPAGPPACFLSGGTDSSTVAGMIREATGQAPHCYSIGFEAEGYDEMAYARVAARAYGAVHYELYITPDDLVREIPLVAAHYDQPFGNSSAVPAYHAALAARGHGVTRLLAGDGGDELFGGNLRYAKQKVFGVWDDMPGPLQAVLGGVFDNRLAGAVPGVKKVTSYIRQARVPMPDRQHTYNLLERLGVDDVLTPSFLALVDPGGPAAHQRTVWAESAGAGLLDRQLAYDWRYTLAENDLPKVTGTAALAGVEVAFPLLDDAIVDFSMQLPTSYKLRGLKLRWFFKEALRGFLPDEILTKKKHGFGLPFGVWAVRHAGLRALAQDTVRAVAARGLVREPFVRDLLDTHLPSHPHYYGEMVWVLMMLECWLRQHAPDWRVPG